MDAVTAITRALDLAAGPAIVLDDKLTVVSASAGAEALLGGEIPRGVSAPALLCGDRPKRPIAEALLEGRPVEALIPRPGHEDRLLRVRSIPLRDSPRSPAQGTGKALGWLLVVEDAGRINDEVVEFHGMTTQDAGMKQLFRMIERVSNDDVTVLVRGESGTGKELVARAIHDESSRKNGPFQAINCAALPATLLEAELFGMVKGAFTGAIKDTPGLVRSAHKGTLFLDEIAELPLELQAKLLRVLETRQVLPVGGHQPILVDVRILSATHRALRKEVEAGRFRADLMYRLRVIPLFLPPLRSRPGDVPVLARRIVEELNDKSTRRRVETISPAALQALSLWAWPGNVRELRNALQYAFAIGDGPVLRPTDLPPELLHEDSHDDDKEPVGFAEPPIDKARIQRALSQVGGNRADAALALGVSRVTLWRWMKEAGIAVRPRR